MKFEDTVMINASRKRVWEFVTDANKVAKCAPGVESVEIIEDNKKFKVVASIGFGNIKVRFTTNLEFMEFEEPNFVKLKAHGTAPGSAVDVIADMRLTDGENNSTNLHWTADINILGTIASLANRMMGSVTQKLSTQFFNSVKQKIEE
jgi:carbon monoxide dehydrogenase subunit G